MMTKNEKSTHRDLESARERLEPLSGKKLWRSLDEWAETDEFRQAMHRHFPSRMEEVLDPVTRRTFLKVMGASLAFAGLSGCSPVQPQERIFPYTGQQPEQLIPGRALSFATAMPLGGYATGLLVTSHMGRPTKVEGNPSHQASLGAADIWNQASVLSLYDPDRSKTVMQNGRVGSWDTFLGAMQAQRERHRANGGAGLRFLSGTVTSPTLSEQMAVLLSPDHYPNARWHQYEPLNNAMGRAASQAALGGQFDAVYNFENADVVLTLESNFLLEGPGHLAYARQFARKRRTRDGQQTILRLYAIESSPTLTGSLADNRLRLRPSQVELAARAIASGSGVAAAGGTGLPAEASPWIAAVVKELQASRGRSVVVPGEYATPAVHAIAIAMNQALGNVGATVNYVPAVATGAGDQIASIVDLARDIAAGNVDTLVMLGVNPVYNAPADIGFEQLLLDKVPLRVHLGEYHDETAFISHWHIPQAHYLESWGDARAFDGTPTIIQPLIAPLYDGKTAYELIAGLLGQGNRASYDIVREYWQRQMPGAATAAAGAPAPLVGGVNAGAVANAAFEEFWAAALNDGVANLPGQQPVEAAPPTRPQPGVVPAVPAGVQPAAPAAQAAPPAAPAAGPAGQQTAPATPAAPAAQQAPPAAAAQQPAQQQPAAPGRPAAVPAVNPAIFATAPVASATGYEIVFRPDPTVYDGSFANSGWLQELPKPLTKLTWDNAAVMSVRMAQELGVKDHDVVRLTRAGVSVDAPVRILPGHPDGCVTVHLGYGRRRAGRVGTGVGFDAYRLRTTDALWFGPGLEVAKTGDYYRLAFTDQHNIIYAGDYEPVKAQREREAGSVRRDYSLHNEYPDDQGRAYVEGQQGRDLFKVATIREFLADPEIFHSVGHEPSGESKGGHTEEASPVEAAGEHGSGGRDVDPGELKTPGEGLPNMLEEWSYANNKWGMSIDTQSCIGCNACVVACQSENNIPVVGKEQVLMHREMHWIRIDTYFEGDVDDPNTYFMPVPCMQCEKAPCEIVCPVGATIHSEEGLNDMVYNRCVGTRYCSNNCPYKVRRFNFLKYSDQSALAQLRANPNVTIRTRGVMEKCTYCVQRIWYARIESEKQNRAIRDGEIKTACQQTCPTEAIVFGNLNDPASAIVALKRSKLDYGLLATLNTRPRTTYLARLTNPNPELGEA